MERVQADKRKAEEQLMPEPEAEVHAVSEHAGVIGAVTEDDVKSLVHMLSGAEEDEAARQFLSMQVDKEPPMCEQIETQEPEHEEISQGMVIDGITVTDEDVRMLIDDENRELDNMILHMCVVEFKPLQSITAEYRKLGVRWVRQKRGPKKWRCRIVAKDFKFLDPHLDHLHTSGACHVTRRVLDLVASVRGNKRIIGDTTNAYFHTPQNKLLYLDWLPALRR
eukprot:4858015-Amphidinium_carterae.1